MSSHWRTAAVAAIYVAVVVAVALRLEPPAAAPAGAPPSAFSAERALSSFRAAFPPETPHPVGSAANRTVRDRIAAEFRALGYATLVDSSFVCNAHAVCANVDNVIAGPPGGTHGRPVVLLVSHYDSVPAGPGASDDGIGAASTIEVARVLRNEKFRNPVAFLVDDGEEAGLLGAEAFVRKYGARVAAVVNVEARGTAGPSFLFETSGNNALFLPRVTSALARPVTSSLFATVYDRLPNDTDLSVFKGAGIPGVNFAFARNVALYHTPLDDARHLDLGSVQHQGDNALAAMRAFANSSLSEDPGRNAVWFDILGLRVVSFPESTARILAIAALLVALAGLSLAFSLRDAIVGISVFLASVAGAAALGALVALLVRRDEWAAYPQTALVAMWIIGLVVPLFTGRIGANRDLFAGCAVAWCSIATIVALTVPGASYLFVVPAIPLALGVPLARAWRGATATAALVAIAAAGMLWFPLALVLHDMLGSISFAVVATIVALVTTIAAAMRVAPPPKAFLVAAVLLVVCIVAARALPAATREHPLRINVVYYDDGAQPRWLVNDLTPALRSAAAFSDEKAAIAPWFRRSSRYFAAPAPRLPLPPVQVTREGSVITLRSQRGADRVSLAMHGTVGAISVNGVPLPARRPRFRDWMAPGWHVVTVRGAEMRVDTGTAAPLEVVGIDTSFGAPRDSAPLRAARDASNGVPSQDGDVTVTVRREKL